jgi:hypothetical protein
MTGYRYWPTATRLNSGSVLIAGGLTASGVTSAETYDPTTGSFTPTIGSMSTNRYDHTATLLNNGQVLITGGTAHNAASTAELYNPLTGMWTSTGSMARLRWRYATTREPSEPLTQYDRYFAGVVVLSGLNIVM